MEMFANHDHYRMPIAPIAGMPLLPRPVSFRLRMARSLRYMSDSFKTPADNPIIFRTMMTRRELLAALAITGAAPLSRLGGYGIMKGMGDIKVLFVAGFGPIVSDTAMSRKLYKDALDIAFKEEKDGYLHTDALQGSKEFALWPLSQAAQSCFGNDSWPRDIPPPQAWLEFDVDSVEKATAELESRGYRMLIKNKKEPWGQTVSRFISPEGLLLGITFTPGMRDKK